MSPNKKMTGKSNIILFALPIVTYILIRDISAAVLVHIWQLVEHAKSLLVAFIPMLFSCINIEGRKPSALCFTKS